MSKHAPLSPSSAARWLRCPASVELSARAPNTSSAEADEGSALHEVRSRCLKHGLDPQEFIGDLFFGGTRRLTLCTRDRIEAIRPGIDRIGDLCGDVVEGRKREARHFLVEQRLKFAAKELKSVYGTLDFAGYVDRPQGAEVVISDLKFGRGVPVHPENNEQQLIYLAMFLESLTRQERDRVTSCRIIIDQPRHAGGGGEWTIGVDDVFTWVEDVLIPGIAVINSGKGGFNPGEYACRWCPSKNNCEAFALFNIETLGIVFDDERDAKTLDPSRVFKLSVERRSYLVRHTEMIHTWLDAAKLELLQDALNGRPTPGFKLVNGRLGDRAWVNPDEAISALTPLLGDQALERKLISPARAQEMLPRKVWEPLSKTLVQRKTGKPCLAPDEDPRLRIPPPVQFEDVSEPRHTKGE